MPELLIELLSEEIPARMQARASEDLKRLITNGLVEAGLTYSGAEAFATPRRLTLVVEGLTEESAATREERKGPRVDAPEKALEGFLRSTGLTKADLETRDDKKGAVWFAVIERPGRPSSEIVAEVLSMVVRAFPWPKSMRWGSGDVRWVRPLHSILCLQSDDTGARVVPLEVAGITSGDWTVGHPIHAPERIQVTSFEDYAAKLKTARVVLSPVERAEQIWHDATTLAFAQGLEVVEDPGLLAEVAGLVEWPVALMGAIDPEFLSLPPEVLRTSMKEHQKFFSVRNPKTERIEGFVTVANTETSDDGATILTGNQKVLSARLSDARFFWENDLRVAEVGMAPWIEALGNVTFHAKLGSQADRIARIATLVRNFAPMVGADADEAEAAAQVAKADLASEMVYEFPELQGVMGRYYAREAGLSKEVAAVAAEHYSPLGPSDDVPTAPLSVAVALADKIDTLTGFWAIDEKPTGSKDPFALRRAALGVIRLLLENGVSLDLLAAIRSAQAQFSNARDDLPSDLLSFFHDRMKVSLREHGLRHDIVDAIIGMGEGNADLKFVVERAHALQAVLDTEDGENLIQGFKRANNILTQAEEADGVEYSFGPEPKLAETDIERALFDALDTADGVIKPAMAAQDFTSAMGAMAGLRGPIDAFFETVQVNAENQILRRNRLNLLHRIRETCLGVADLTRLEG